MLLSRVKISCSCVKAPQLVFHWWLHNIIPLHEKFLHFDWLRAVVFQLNLKYLHVKITKPLQVVV